MPAGAPRTVSLQPDEMIQLGKEMISWVKKHDPLHLSAWYSIEKEFTENEWKTMIVRPEFVGYYERAMKIVGQKYLDKDSKIRNGIAERWQRIYFKDLKEEEDNTADRNAERQAKAHKAESQAASEYAKEVNQTVLRNRKKPK